jgi:hypothetical protein
VSCGRTSDHAYELDAQVELEQYECNMPWVEMPPPLTTTPAIDSGSAEIIHRNKFAVWFYSRS